MGRIGCLYNKINQSSAQVLLCVPETGSFHTELLFVLEVCYADKLGVWWLFIAESRELLCFGKSSGVPEGPCLVCASGYSWLLISPASMSICSQQQCRQEAFGLIFLGSDVFFIRSALKLLGAKSQSSWRREPRQRSLRACNVNVSVQMKGSRKCGGGGSLASFNLCPVPGSCIRQLISHTFEKQFLTPLSTKGNKIF